MQSGCGTVHRDSVGGATKRCDSLLKPWYGGPLCEEVGPQDLRDGIHIFFAYVLASVGYHCILFSGTAAAHPESGPQTLQVHRSGSVCLGRAYSGGKGLRKGGSLRLARIDRPMPGSGILSRSWLPVQLLSPPSCDVRDLCDGRVSTNFRFGGWCRFCWSLP